MARCKDGQIKKAQIAGLLEQLEAWKKGRCPEINSLSPKFQKWVSDQIAEIENRIKSQDFLFAVQSCCKHVATTVSRMNSGEIIDVSDDGSGFTLAKRASRKVAKFGIVSP